ncbi:hypothetical protein ACFUMJ_18465 [Streptomyces olivaceus]|nr:hypothetical protein [Streptomyces sp. CB09030]UOG83824.1 hypothetical protein L6J92_33725 [Streptomyces sp. CB09030]
MATKSVLTEAQQREMQASPFNLRRGLAAGMLHTNQNYCAVLAGGNILVGEGPMIVANREPLLQLTPGASGHVSLSLTLYSEVGELLGLIVDNEWLSGDVSVWDMESDHQRLVIRSKANKVALNLNMKGEPAHLRAKLWHSGHLIDLRGTGIRVNGKNTHQNIAHAGFVGMVLELDTTIPRLRMVPQLENAAIVSDPDPLTRLNQAIAVWKRLKRESSGSAAKQS